MGVFHVFLTCTNGTKLHNAPLIEVKPFPSSPVLLYLKKFGRNLFHSTLQSFKNRYEGIKEES